MPIYGLKLNPNDVISQWVKAEDIKNLDPQ